MGLLMLKKLPSQSSGDSPENLTPLPTGDRRRSVLHDGITIRGDWESEGIVEFGGSIVGNVTADTLVVTENGKVRGSVWARNVTIAGALDGAISAVNVTLKRQARVSAQIEAHVITIDGGANLEGQVRAAPRNI